MKQPTTKYLKDYRPPSYLVKSIDLHFSLYEDRAFVSSTLEVRRNNTQAKNFELDGKDLDLTSIAINDQELEQNAYQLFENKLVLLSPPESFRLSIITRIFPQTNTSLEGLYRSNNLFCTQCEAEGFRKITFFPDRPDVMTRYTTTIEAEKRRYPILLSNGNLIEQGDVTDNRHYAKWQDPFPKPSYLFAMVAGDLGCINDNFTTQSGRDINLAIYVEHHNTDKCTHAMESLKKAMAWDEKRFNLEYDLDQYMIVAVDDFNAGAMENKGLNIFNSKCVMAKPQTATDIDYEAIEAVVAHEYFHNWTGNRVTCRDWFQLSLKEGLTVFRDQEFSADHGSRAVKRISDATVLRNHQFLEDASPMAHPIRPESYIEINNFYTLTVYEKGAEVIRMLHTILADDFYKGVALYIDRHDGQAATTDDFVQAMEDVLHESTQSGLPNDLKQFRLWYSQAGTPTVRVDSLFDQSKNTFSLTFSQEPPTIKGIQQKNLHIPIAMGLISQEGNEHPLLLQGEQTKSVQTSKILHLYQEHETFTFENISEKPIPSLQRGFSSPIKLIYDYSDNDLYFLLLNDTDPFSRWEAGQRLYLKQLLALVDDVQSERDLAIDQRLCDFFQQTLTDNSLDDKSFVAQLLTLPSEDYLAEQTDVVNVMAIHQARHFLRKEIGHLLLTDFLNLYKAYQIDQPYKYSPELAGKRRMKNLCLSYLMAEPNKKAIGLCCDQFYQANNMTDEISALQALVHSGCNESSSVLADFYDKWPKETLVIDKWFAIQATAPQANTLEKVKKLMSHAQFNIKNPNKVRSLIGAFTANNVCFHNPDGSGYRFLAEQIAILDKLNPSIAARLVAKLSRWQRFGEPQQQLMKETLEEIHASKDQSKGVYEIVSKSLEG